MLVGYAIEAVLAAAYLIAFLSFKERQRLEGDKVHLTNKSLRNRLLQAFSGTIVNFVDSALLFGFSIQITSFLFAVQNMRGINYPSTSYSLALAKLTSILSTVIVMSLGLLQSRSISRKRLRNYIGLSLFIANVATMFTQLGTHTKNIWDKDCFQVGYLKYLAVSANFVSGLFFPLAIIVLFYQWCERSRAEYFEVYKNETALSLPNHWIAVK